MIISNRLNKENKLKLNSYLRIFDLLSCIYGY